MRVGWKLRVEVGNDEQIFKGKRLRSEPAETPYAENGTYGVVGGRRLATPSSPIDIEL